jgi:hypothetical protein
MSPIPRFKEEFLESLAFAFRKRHKAIKYSMRPAEFAKTYDRSGSERSERLEISLRHYSDAWLTLHAWPDRMIWLDARRREKTGPRWKWSFEGRLVGDSSPLEVVAALEETIALLFEMDAPRTHVLNGPWIRLLAQGPKPIQ